MIELEHEKSIGQQCALVEHSCNVFDTPTDLKGTLYMHVCARWRVCVWVNMPNGSRPGLAGCVLFSSIPPKPLTHSHTHPYTQTHTHTGSNAVQQSGGTVAMSMLRITISCRCCWKERDRGKEMDTQREREREREIEGEREGEGGTQQSGDKWICYVCVAMCTSPLDCRITPSACHTLIVA